MTPTADITVIEARDLDEAWYLTVKECFGLNSKRYIVTKGSFEGQTRYQINSLALVVSHPETRPLAPIMPGGCSLDPPASESYIFQYFAEYIMNPEKAPNEEYSYGEFIYPHINRVIKMLAGTPETNQAVINIGEAFEYKDHDGYGEGFRTGPRVYENPPCLRCINWQYNNDELDIHTFWRSWDIYSGMPINLGGIQLLNEYVASECGCNTGKLYAYSSGAHVYEYCKELVEARYGKTY